MAQQPVSKCVTISHSNIFAHRMLTDQGAYVHTHYPDSWEDIGDAENGPQVVGGPAYDEYSGDSDYFIIDPSGLIVAQMAIDWAFVRWYAEHPDPSEEEREGYKRPRYAGEDYQVIFTDEDGRWYACHDYGWTDDPREAAYLSAPQAAMIAGRFNCAPKDRLTSKAVWVLCAM